MVGTIVVICYDSHVNCCVRPIDSCYIMWSNRNLEAFWSPPRRRLISRFSTQKSDIMCTCLWVMSYGRKWREWHVIWFTRIFYKYDHIMLFLCRVRRRPPLEPRDQVSYRIEVTYLHATNFSMKYVYVIYETILKVFKFAHGIVWLNL